MTASITSIGARPVVVTAAVCLLLFVTAGVLEPDFFSLQIFASFFSNRAVLGVVAVGMTFVILSGGIDLSVGAVAGCATIAMATLLERWQAHPALACLLVVGGGAMFGAGMGALIHGFQLPPFIVTLGGMFIARGLAFTISRESMPIDEPLYDSVSQLPARAMEILGASQAAAEQFGYMVPATSLLFMLVFAIAVIALMGTRFGRNVYAVGGSEHSARLMGVGVGHTRVGVYAISGACAAIGGVVHTLSLSSGDPSSHVMLELDAIAAVVIGGTVLSGGVGGAAGTLLGVILFGIIETWITMREGMDSAWTRIVVGTLLLAFILMQRALLREE